MPASKFIDAGDLRIHYLEEGGGAPLIAIHGAMGTAETSWTEIGPLADRYHLFAPDSRGHGQTNNPAQALSYAQMADDVVAFADAVGLDRPLIHGYSDGGQIALEIALRHPGRTRALVLGAMVSAMTDENLAGLADWGFSPSGAIDHAALEAAWGDYYRGFPAAHDHGKRPGYWRTLLSQHSRMWFSIPPYSDERLGTIRDPVLIICADRDEVGSTVDAPHLLATIPGSELAVIPNTTHTTAQASPLFWSAVHDFLARHSG